MKILGIESSCDDTGIAVIQNGVILENIVIKQDHKYGVIPEFAAREHHLNLFKAVRSVFHSIDLIAYTNSPGLMGSLFVGSSFAKGLAYASNLPTIAINHLQAHFLLPFWLFRFQFPFLTLLISGGHTLLIEVFDVDRYSVVSSSLDDAVGEVFDKVARHLGLDYPGGAHIEQLATLAPHKYVFSFPQSMIFRDEFSFSGLKTAAIKQISSDASLDQKADFSFQFQEHVAFLLVSKMVRFFMKNSIKNWVVSGGVASNQAVRMALQKQADLLGCSVFFPPIELCTDNGVMIAAVADLLFPKIGPSSFSLKPSPSFDC